MRTPTLLRQRPDRSDNNIVRFNRIVPDVRAEHVDGKAGSAHNRIESNTFDGTGQKPCCAGRGAVWVNSWVEITGKDYVLMGNWGTNPIKFGYNIQRVDRTSSRARCRLGTSGCGSYGNRTRYEGGSTGNVIKCSNAVVSGAFARDTYTGKYLACTP